MKNYFLLACAFFLLTASVRAETLQGLANIEIHNKKTVLELTQIVTVQDDKAEFVNLDDWGSTSFTVKFEKGKLRFESKNGSTSTSLKRALSLPLTQKEFLAILHYMNLKDDFTLLPNAEQIARAEKSEYDCVYIRPNHGLPKALTWQHRKHKNLKLLFQDFVRTENGKIYPKNILITYKKTIFHLKWQKLTFKN